MVTVSDVQTEAPPPLEAFRYRGRHGHGCHRHFSSDDSTGRRHRGGLPFHHLGLHVHMQRHCHRGVCLQSGGGNSGNQGGPAASRGPFLGPRGHGFHRGRRAMRSLSPGFMLDLQENLIQYLDLLGLDRVESMGRELGALNHRLRHRHGHRGYHGHHGHHGHHGRHGYRGLFGHHPHHCHQFQHPVDLHRPSSPQLVVPEIVEGMAQLQLAAPSQSESASP